MELFKTDILIGRRLELFSQPSCDEWGYEKPQTDTFAVLYPKEFNAQKEYPLYVVFHSAGHDVYSCLECIKTKGNHDIYHVPDDMFGLFLDCRANTDGTADWWWGGIDAQGRGSDDRRGVETRPVEKRCIATIEWTMDMYPINRQRVYGVGNSMGGSGVLGIALPRGDIFAAIKANVPAGVRHAADRCCLDTEAPDGFAIPDPPILVDYSSQVDEWSNGHEVLYNGMRDKKYPIMGFWGTFGHANNHENIAKYNDLIHAFDVFAVEKNCAYPVFTNATTDDVIPWPDNRDCGTSGQVNGFFRWNVIKDADDGLDIELRLMNADEWTTRVQLPTESVADVTLRRLQSFAPCCKVKYSFGDVAGEAELEDGVITVKGLKITQTPTVLSLRK